MQPTAFYPGAPMRKLARSTEGAEFNMDAAAA